MKEKNFLILGATGGSGKLTVEQALENGHRVTVYARDPTKLPESVHGHEKLTVLKGDLPSAPATLHPLLPSFDAIISVLGPNSITYTGTDITQLYQWILEELRKLPREKRPYILAMGTQSIVDPEDGFSLFTRIHIFIIKNLARGARKEIIGCGKVFQDELAQEKSKPEDERLDWTVYRLNLLKDLGWPKDRARAGYVAKDDWQTTMDRVQLAAWLVGEAEKERDQRVWLSKMPALWGESTSE